MRQFLFTLVTIVAPIFLFSQTDTTAVKFKLNTDKVLDELSQTACKCIDSIDTFNKSKKEIAAEIHSCIDKQVSSYQMIKKLSSIKDLKEATNGEQQNVNIEINVNPDSNDYKKHYYEIESYLMENCSEIKSKIAVNDEVTDKSLSRNPEAMKFYNLALEVTQEGDFEKAITYYKKALVYDKEFAFAYDNMGICYRRLNDYDNAIESYEKSLKINPNGLMPLQNIAVAYSYKKDYKKAVKAFERLAKVDPKNPEVFYGIGQLYTQHLFDYEKGLENLCQAYNIYIEQKSPYRSDAEKLIQVIYAEMKKQGKEAAFDATLKKYHLTPE